MTELAILVVAGFMATIALTSSGDPIGGISGGNKTQLAGPGWNSAGG